ncbi:MAG: aminotransferase class I/II-fold pyridoxal phosphate-dependent enzyme [Limnochordales bacterium]|nr:aminotransferase class I/II-fold pyridoxal phosphate-dependent enzyme [Limnochordales bacterium]
MHSHGPQGSPPRPAMRPRTLMVHGGHGPDPHTGAVNVPVYLSSTFAQEQPGVPKGYEYARTGNPTREAVERHIAALEGGVRGLAFASGLAAETTVLSLLSAGDHVIVGDDVYGGTYRLMAQVFSRLGLSATFADTADIDAFAAAFRPETRMVIMESLTNPLMKVSDLERVAAVTHAHGALLVVDNTFLTPYFQRPLLLGADIVVHSATKYLGGHSDVVAGLVVVKDDELGQRLHYLQNAMGAVLGVQDSYLLLRGMKTLALRMEAHAENARRLAEWLRQQPWVKRVLYPGLPDHPGHDILARQATGFGGMLSFEADTAARAQRIVTGTRIFALAESLGGVESLISIPARMTHASIPPERRAELGITDSLVRVSVGIEDVEDLIADLDQAAKAL